MTSTERKLHLNRRYAILGGVCSGLADYFNISRLIVRVIFVIATFTWWPTLFVYIGLYFCLSDRKPSFSEMGEGLKESRVGRHLQGIDYGKRIYKNIRNKKISGVCAGIADYLEISPFFVRAAFLLSLFFGPFAIIAYVLAAIIMDVNPEDLELRRTRRDRGQTRRHRRHSRHRENRDSEEKEFQSTPREPRFDRRNLRDCTEKFSTLEKKLQRLEATITSKKFKLHSELKRMST